MTKREPMPNILARCGLVGLAIVLATIAVAAQARSKVSVTGSNASVDPVWGAGLIYSCASNAPSRGDFRRGRVRQDVGNVLPLTRSSGERCFEDEICPSPWIQYERTTNFPGQEPETQDAWSCQSRSSWCWVAGGEGCFCSGTQPPGTWTRVDDRSDVSVVPNLWAAPLPPVTDLLPGETHVAWDKLEVGNIYRLMNSVDLTTWGRNGPVQGLRFINAWRIIVVRKIDRLVPDDPWYYVRVVTPGSFSDPDNDGDGWIKGTEFMELGVAEQP